MHSVGLFDHDALVPCGECKFDATLWQIAFEVASRMCLKAGGLALCFVGEIFLNDAELAEIFNGGCDVLLLDDTLSDDQADGIAVESLTPVIGIHFMC